MTIIAPNPHEKLIKCENNVRTLLKITHLAFRKSYLVTICASENKPTWSHVASIHMESLPNV